MIEQPYAAVSPAAWGFFKLKGLVENSSLSADVVCGQAAALSRLLDTRFSQASAWATMELLMQNGVKDSLVEQARQHSLLVLFFAARQDASSAQLKLRL